MDELIKIIMHLNLDWDDLIREAEIIEDYGEYLHVSLMGYSADDIRKAADTLFPEKRLL